MSQSPLFLQLGLLLSCWIKFEWLFPTGRRKFSRKIIRCIASRSSWTSFVSCPSSTAASASISTRFVTACQKAILIGSRVPCPVSLLSNPGPGVCNVVRLSSSLLAFCQLLCLGCFVWRRTIHSLELRVGFSRMRWGATGCRSCVPLLSAPPVDIRLLNTIYRSSIDPNVAADALDGTAVALASGRGGCTCKCCLPLQVFLTLSIWLFVYAKVYLVFDSRTVSLLHPRSLLQLWHSISLENSIVAIRRFVVTRCKKNIRVPLLCCTGAFFTGRACVIRRFVVTKVLFFFRAAWFWCSVHRQILRPSTR